MPSYHFVSEDGWEDYCSSEEEHWELTKLYTMAGTPYTVEMIEEEDDDNGNDYLNHPSLSAQQRNPNLR